MAMPPKKISTQMVMNMAKNRSSELNGACSLRLPRASSSSGLPCSTMIMSSTAFSMPPEKSPARKAGTMSFSMISLVCRSVSVPSSP